MNQPDILLEGSGVVAVLKPPGLATQAPPGIESVEVWLRTRLGLGGAGYLGVPHRLDRAVSGVVLMAATPRAARKLSRQFERREITKTYLAVVQPGDAAAGSAPGPEVCAWRDHVRKIAEQARSEIVAASEPASREAVTRVRRLAADAALGPRMLLQLEPLTGRMHQLRLQAASRGLPIVGDSLYGGPPFGLGDERERPILLHACMSRRVAMSTHPASPTPMRRAHGSLAPRSTALPPSPARSRRQMAAGSCGRRRATSARAGSSTRRGCGGARWRRWRGSPCP